MSTNIIESDKYKTGEFILENSSVKLYSTIEENIKEPSKIYFNTISNINLQNIEVIIDYELVDFSSLPILNNYISYDKESQIITRNTIYDYTAKSSSYCCFFNTINISTKTYLSKKLNFVLIDYDIDLNFNAELSIKTSNETNLENTTEPNNNLIYYSNDESNIFAVLQIDTKNHLQLINSSQLKYSITSKDRVTFNKKIIFSAEKINYKKLPEVFSTPTNQFLKG